MNIYKKLSSAGCLIFTMFLMMVFKLPISSAFSISGWGHGADGYERALYNVKSDEAPLILYFNTDWCGWCKRLNKEYLDASEVRNVLRDIEKVEINPDKGAKEKTLADQYRVRGFPSFFVLIPAFGNSPKKVYPFHRSSPNDTKKQFADKILAAITDQYAKKARDLKKQNQLKKSIEYYQKALKYDKNNFEAHYGIGMNYHNMGYQQKDLELARMAKENYQRALEIKPNDSGCKSNLERLNKFISFLGKNTADSSVESGPAASGQSIANEVVNFPEDDSIEEKPETKCVSGDCENGQGVYISSDGVRYEGQFRHGRFNGKGHYVSSNGATYDGEFKNSTFHGKGTYIYKDGRKYVGQFQEDFFKGHGTLTYPDGRKYVGQFRNDRFNGRGVFYYPDGSKVEGNFRNGKFAGE